jgi:carbon-monoxide dehydrogenase medium subunit
VKLPPLELRIARTEAEALELLATLGSDARVLAGGQSLLPLLRFRMARPHVLIDINRVESLRALHVDTDSLRIGALVRHSELETAGPGPSGICGLLRAHAREIAFWPVRTQGTAVGSVVHADPKGDWPLAFFALDASIELASHRGRRSVPVREFILGPLETTRGIDELATGIHVRTAGVTRWGRSKLQHRAGEYAACSAIVLQRGKAWECWIGAAGDRPFQLPDVGALLAQGPVATKQVVAAAEAELSRWLPEAGAAERRRHAVNLADAVNNAQGAEH